MVLRSLKAVAQPSSFPTRNRVRKYGLPIGLYQPSKSFQNYFAVMFKSRTKRMFKKVIQRGRSERKAEAYPCGTLRL
jgi:hypothetical protein